MRWLLATWLATAMTATTKNYYLLYTIQWNRPITGIFRWQSPIEDEQAWEKLWETPVIEFEFFACLVNQITWLLSSYVKISWLLWLHYKSCLLHQTKMLVVWHFSGVYIINRTLHDHLEIRNFSSGVEKLMFHEVVIFEEKILYLCAEIKGKARDIRGNLVKSHHLRHHTEAVRKILKTSYIVYFQKISIPYLEGNECCW